MQVGGNKLHPWLSMTERSALFNSEPEFLPCVLDSSQHQQRFFSDRTPPPVPRKRFVRTLSFPATSLSLQCPQSPLSPVLKNPQNFDNPLYMLAPIPNHCFHQCPEELGPARKSASYWSSFSLLSFDTADEHLSLLLSSCDDHSALYQVIQQCHLLCLRSLSQSLESRILLRDEGADNHLSSYQPRDFLLQSDSQPTEVGDRVYHSLQSHRFPGRRLALKVQLHLFVQLLSANVVVLKSFDNFNYHISSVELIWLGLSTSSIMMTHRFRSKILPAPPHSPDLSLPPKLKEYLKAIWF